MKFHKMQSYSVHLHRFVHTIGNYVRDGHPIAGMNEPFRNDWPETFAHFVGIAWKSREIGKNEQLARWIELRECCPINSNAYHSIELKCPDTSQSLYPFQAE